jgi:hypothetical protein
MLPARTQRHAITAALLAAPLTFHASCTGPGPCVAGKGEVEERDVQVMAFSGVVVHGSMDAVLYPGERHALRVEGQPNLIDLVQAEVKDGALHLSLNACVRSSTKPFRAHITLPTFDRLELRGSGDIRSSGAFTCGDVRVALTGSGDLVCALEAGHVDAELKGSGDLLLRGSARSLNATLAGSGDLDAGALEASSAKARVTGSGDITVRTDGVLDASVTGSGDIRYVGTPSEVLKQVNGSGYIKGK